MLHFELQKVQVQVQTYWWSSSSHTEDLNCFLSQAKCASHLWEETLCSLWQQGVGKRSHVETNCSWFSLNVPFIIRTLHVQKKSAKLLIQVRIYFCGIPYAAHTYPDSASIPQVNWVRDPWSKRFKCWEPCRSDISRWISGMNFYYKVLKKLHIHWILVTNTFSWRVEI